MDDNRRERIRQSAERTAEVSAGLNERLADDERRERHETALRRAEGAEYYETDDAYFTALAVAAMAVADAEMRAARMEAAQLVARQYTDENARLRAELETTHKRGSDTIEHLCGEVNRLRAELEVVRTEMVRQGQENSAYGREIDRLRADLRDSHRVAEHYMQLAAERLATIERLRSVLDEWYGTSDASALSAEIRAVLEGEQ